MSAVRRRIPASETRDALVDAALDRIASDGISVNLDSVSLEELVRDADVPRSSAYAAWQQVADEDQTPQMAFRREVLRRALVGGAEGARNSRPMVEATAAVLEQRGEFDASDLAAEMIRKATAAQFDDAAQRQVYKVSAALASAAVSVPAGEMDDEVIGWLSEVESAYVESMAEAFRGFASLTGRQPAPDLEGPWFWQRFTTAVLALGEGLHPRLYTAPREVLYGIVGPGSELGSDDRGGGEAEWTLFGIGMQALFDRFFVPTSAEADC